MGDVPCKGMGCVGRSALVEQNANHTKCDLLLPLLHQLGRLSSRLRKVFTAMSCFSYASLSSSFIAMHFSRKASAMVAAVWYSFKVDTTAFMASLVLEDPGKAF